MSSLEEQIYDEQRAIAGDGVIGGRIWHDTIEVRVNRTAQTIILECKIPLKRCAYAYVYTMPFDFMS